MFRIRFRAGLLGLDGDAVQFVVFVAENGRGVNDFTTVDVAIGDLVFGRVDFPCDCVRFVLWVVFDSGEPDVFGVFGDVGDEDGEQVPVYPVGIYVAVCLDVTAVFDVELADAVVVVVDPCVEVRDGLSGEGFAEIRDDFFKLIDVASERCGPGSGDGASEVHRVSIHMVGHNIKASFQTRYSSGNKPLFSMPL